jgi:hypothetical protein
MRVMGTVEFVNDLEMKKKLLDAKPFLKQAGLTPENPGLILLKIIKCTAHFWTFATNNQPKNLLSSRRSKNFFLKTLLKFIFRKEIYLIKNDN